MVIQNVDRDGELLEALRRREPGASERLIETYGTRAYRLAMNITRNRADAEEVVQDALLSAIRKIDMFRGDSSFGSWLYRIVTNAAYQKARSRPGRHTEIALDDVLPVFHEDGGPGSAVDWSGRVGDVAHQTELRLALAAALDELPAHYRVVLVLHDVEGRPNPEVAETLSLSVGSVKSRLHRARLFIRKRLTEHAAARPAADEEGR